MSFRRAVRNSDGGEEKSFASGLLDDYAGRERFLLTQRTFPPASFVEMT
jgi:hypothetical protein